MLGSCVSKTTPTPTPSDYQQAYAEALRLHPPAQRARALENAAAAAPQPQRQRIELEAAEQWMQASNDATALTVASRLDFSGDSDEWILRRQMLIAQLRLNQNDLAGARSALSFVNQLQVGPQQLASANQLLAAIHEAGSQPPESIADLVSRLTVATSATQQRRLQAKILSELQRFPLFALESDNPDNFGTSVIPWANLAHVALSEKDPLQRLTKLNQWQQQYPHIQIDTGLLTEIEQPELSATAPPARIALLLPYTGKLAHAGRALHDGIMTAYFDTALARSTVEFRSYDNNDTTDIGELYRRAVADGAEFIIGPLRKEHIRQLIEQHLITVPTLALNYADTAEQSPLLLQLGLSPEDEINQLSRLAWALGHRRAASFYPDNPLGTRLNDAFEKSWLALGGSYATGQAYPTKAHDYSAEIQTVLGLDRSKQRHRKLQQTLNLPLQFTPHRRQDIDFLFLAAFPAQARAIRPQFRFHQADDLPIFATSHLYSGTPNSLQNMDLNQVRLCDTPYTFSEHARNQPLPRIYALGNDAFSLLPYLTSLKASSLRGFEGTTGVLRIDQSGRFNAQLTCGRFRRGVPEEIAEWG